MLSKKLTFSLASLVILIAFGLVCFAPSAALGHAEDQHPAKFEADTHETWWDGHVHPTVEVTAADIDPSDGPPKIQLVAEDNSDPQVAGEDSSDKNLKFRISFSKPVNLDNTTAVVPSTIAKTSKALTEGSGNLAKQDFHIIDIRVVLYDKDFAPLGFVEWLAGDEGKLTHASPGRLGQDFDLEIDTERIIRAGLAGQSRGETYALPDLRSGANAAVDADRVRYVTVSVLDSAARNADQSDVLTALTDPVKKLQWNIVNAQQFELVRSDLGTARVLKMEQRVPRSDFTAAAVTGPFDVEILLSEEPAAFTAAHLDVKNGTVTSVVKGIRKGLIEFLPLSDSMIIDADDADGDDDRTEERAIRSADFTGRGFMLSQEAIANIDPAEQVSLQRRSAAKLISYLVTIQPDFKGDIVVKVKNFDGRNSMPPNIDTYIQPGELELIEGAHKLTVKVGKPASPTVLATATTAYETRSKENEGIFDLNPNLKAIGTGLVIPAKGYLVLAAGKTDSAPISGVQNVDAKIAKKLTPAQKLYNVVYDFKLPFPADNLATFFRNGGSLSLVHADIPAATGSGHDKAKASAAGADYTGYVGATTKQYAAGSVIINEIMWGLDGESVNAQYIELHNMTAADIGIDHLEWAIAVGSGAALGGTVLDTVSNTPGGKYWEVPGNSGVTSVRDTFLTVSDLVSMSRVDGATDGTAAASWAAANQRPTANVIGRRIGTPGAANGIAAPAPTPTPTPTPKPKAPVATGSDLMISEIMVASNDGRLPQWIEIANGSGAAVSLMGWSIDVDNDPADTDVVAESVNVEIGDVTVGKDQVVLVVTKTGRNSGVGTGIGDFRADRIVDVQSQVSAKDARYSLISEMAFKVALLPPQKGGVVERGDVVGNLGIGWELPMAESDRSSLIRREGKKGEILGTDAAGWVLASDTTLNGAYVNTYYGDDEDMGTPGYDAGGALPVELSKFTAKRDPLTGQVKITWETQSELNNAGFFIKRSQQKNAQFVAVNPTMIAGAGTTSEKQSYTYTDTTAQPNIVYYYQIEDVSLDGNRQTLTRAHRLKGHIGAAGKATTTWGDLKTSREQ